MKVEEVPSFSLSQVVSLAGLLCWSGGLWVAFAADEADLLHHCITKFDPTVNYYQKSIPPEALNQSFVLPIPLDLQEVDTATGFAVNYGNYYKIVENQFFNLTYVLYQCGAPRPSPLAIGLSTATRARTFQLPLTDVSADSTIPLAFLEVIGFRRVPSLLGGLDNLLLPLSATEYISSSCILQYIDDGSVRTIPDSVENVAELIFTAALGKPVNESNAVSFDATYDGGPLKRAEWIKYMATFLNAEDMAEEIYTYISTSYQCMNESMANSTSKPVIAWLQYDSGVWYVSDATYKLQFDQDAGGSNLENNYLGMSFNSSNSSELRSFHRLLREVDVVVDETAADPYKYTVNNFTDNARVEGNGLDIPALDNRRVWRVDKRLGLNNGYDWYESAIPQPHIVLYDLIGILHPSKGWNQTYFRNIAMDESVANVSAVPCTRSLNEALDVEVIQDPAIMACVDTAREASQGMWSTFLPSLNLQLLLMMCTLFLLTALGSL